MRFFSLLFFGLYLGARTCIAQDVDEAVPLALNNGVPVVTGPQIAYENAVLPKDHKDAWEMVRAANGLRGYLLTPWYLHATYKTFDAYGRSKSEGTLEYVWAGRNKWHVTYTEPGLTWTRWKTEAGMYDPARQPTTLPYPEHLLTSAIHDPLGFAQAPRDTPEYFADENFMSLTLSCFRNTPGALPVAAGGNPFQEMTPVRFCTAQGRPVLRLAQGDYDVYLNKSVSFQHRIVAQQVDVFDSGTPVLSITIDALHSPTAAQLASIAPPVDAMMISDATVILPSTALHLIAEKQPHAEYPRDAKQRHIQGNVRLKVLIDTQGKSTVLEVLHSPDPELSKAAEDAVSRWTYEPYLKDGKLVTVTTTVKFRFGLKR